MKKSDLSENERSSINEKKIKLIEIEKVLTSKEKQTSIINLYIFSFVIFILMIGSSLASLLYNILMKNKIFNFYNLLEKTDILYKDILSEIFLVREMILISDSNYNNIYQSDRNQYFLNFSSVCKEYYLETSAILSNLSTSINSLKEKEKNKMMNKKGYLVIIDKIHSNNSNYELLIYSAFHEINAALYHISQMNISDVDEYEENIFYFMRNSLNIILEMINEQIEIIVIEFYDTIKTEKYYLLIFIAAMVVLYIASYLIYIYFYSKVDVRKKSYLSIFDDIGKEYIFDSLKKCEKFSQKVHLKEEFNISLKDNISNNLSLKDDEDKMNNIDFSSSNILKKIKDNKQVNSLSRIEAKNILSCSKENIFGIILFLILFLVQLYSYVYYYIRLNLYKKCMQYEYYNNKYYSLFLLPFLAIREYLHQSKNTLLGFKLPEYLENTLTNYYVDLNEISESRNKYSKYLPKSYNDFLDDLYNNKQCFILDNFISEYRNKSNNSCSSFFYNMSYFGFDSITMSFIEEIRMMYYEGNKTYNSEDDDTIIKKGLNTILQNDKYKTTVIIYRFIIMKVVEYSLDELFKAVNINFDETTKISLIINIIFMVVVLIGFVGFWIPFMHEENETIYKTKKMLCIIPKDVLLDLPNINAKLGIEGDY